MFNFDKIDTQRLVVSGIGAVAMTLASLTIAAGPVNAATVQAATVNAPVTLADWQGQVGQKLDRIDDLSSITQDRRARQVTLQAAFDANGDYAGAQVLQSSGNRAIDRHAVRIANTVSYPALPAGYRGKPQTVAVKLFFEGADTALAASKQPIEERMAQVKRAGTQVAAK